ncbi:hypothetical protein [Wenxinia marina]|uniref:Uncharacterized protein n=1 Tax=Wenxinia marina DSM 24838 TaxID=1123501 RepID=A0A0D0PCW6_9RHOB|nr:hypothetical protein [Wenxinia marina]KIQ69256.1 hypothetical protein Wenmar_02327 [Wenxinia marina DSM 24838]GGL71542.1 hypothetical protein GCM10011392_27670 [Wenxinia marina]
MAQPSSSSRVAAGHSLFDRMGKKQKKTDRAPAPAQTILVGAHGRYQVKSGWLAGGFVARAFPKPPARARGMIAEATGATEEAAIAALHDVIDAREAQRTKGRRADPQTGLGIPSVEEYVEAVGQVTLSRPQTAMLTALCLAGEDGLTDARIARAAGYKSEASANRSLAAAGLLIAEYLSVDTRARDDADTPDGAALLGFRTAGELEGETGRRILHPEVCHALRMAL